MAVALLARRPDALDDLVKSLRSQVPGGVLETFTTDTTPDKLRKTFADIKAHDSFKDLKLKIVGPAVLHPSTRPHDTPAPPATIPNR